MVVRDPKSGDVVARDQEIGDVGVLDPSSHIEGFADWSLGKEKK